MKRTISPLGALRRLRNYAVKNYEFLNQFIDQAYVHTKEGRSIACLILAKNPDGTNIHTLATRPTNRNGRTSWLGALQSLGRDRTIMLMDLMLLGRVKL